jgi:sirohydrochlorin ferrochelatase
MAPHSPDAPRLLLVAHGTASPAGAATTARLRDSIHAARPSTEVDLCFLDVVDPRLADALDDRPTVVVPLLLSTGYHVQTDIPAAVAPHPHVRVARHLGPHALLVDALMDRLRDIPPGSSTALVGTGSSRPEAASELAESARLLADRLNRRVHALTFGGDLGAGLAAMPAPVQVSTYLLAEGQFFSALCDVATGLGSVAAPLGVHPALVELVWLRYDEALVG